MAALTDEDRVRKVIDKLAHSADEVPVPGAPWAFVDFLELPSGNFRLVAQVEPGSFIDVRVDPAAKLRAVRTAIRRAMDAEAETKSAVG